MTRRYTSHEDVRALLRSNPDGLSYREILERFSTMTTSSLRRILINMPDSYIDRWESAPRKTYKAIWCVVTPPENCPHPTKGTKK
jgi:hypothetical protein